MDTSITNETTNKEPNINCTLAESASHMLIQIIEQIVEDINYFPTMEDSNEFKLLVKLGEHKFHQHLCRNCISCLNHELLTDGFYRFFSVFKQQYQKNEKLLEKIEEKYDINYTGVNDEVEFMLFIVNKTKLIEKHISADEYECLIGIKNAIELAHKQLSSWYIRVRMAACHDITMGISHIYKQQRFNYELIDTSEKTTVYFDQNVIAQYSENEKLKKRISNLKKNNMVFVYSSYIIEDAIKMQQLYMKEFLINLKELTDNKVILRNGNNIGFFHEDIKYSVDRVNLLRPYTKATEKELIYKSMKYRLEYPIFNKKGKYYADINKDLIKFLVSLKVFKNKDKELDESIDSILIFNCNFLGKKIDDSISIPIKYESLDEKFYLIDDLTTLLNILNYKVENINDHKKIMSSLQDAEHIKVASIADYMVTEDNRLRDRAKLIYQILNIETKVMSLSEFEKFSNEILKTSHFTTIQQ